MSRKSKRRRAQQGQAATPDGFEFLDDRAERGTVTPMAASPLGPSAAPAPTPTGAPRTKSPAQTRTASQPQSQAAAETAGGDVVHDEDAAATTVTVETATTAGNPHADAVAPVATETVDAVAAQPPRPSLGETLVRAREARHLSLEAVSARTRINVMLLEHLENDRFDAFPAAAYARGSLRAYGTFLGVDVATLMQRYDEWTTPAAPATAARGPEPMAKQAANSAKPAKFAQTAVRPAAARARSNRPVTGPQRRSMRWGTVIAVAGGIAAVAAGWGIFTVVARNPAEVGSRGGLNQIEEELRRTQTAPQSRAPVPATNATGVPGVATLPAPAEDTASPAPDATAGAGKASHIGAIAPLARSDASATPAPITDLVPVPVPSGSHAQAVAPGAAQAATPVIPAGALVLQATAVGPCAMRVQIDADAAGAVLHQFAAGESMSWTAQRSFRLTPRRGARANLHLTLNGKPIATPVAGKSVRIGASTLEPPAPAPRRRRATTTRNRARKTAPRTTPAPSAQPAPVLEPHGGQPPPR